jgi:demethylmenaquinone methyltransferase/2-methoxy-6-polyprenyl-1,4-benzoquinol methylase
MHRVLSPGGRVAILEFGVPDVPVISTIYKVYLNRVLPALGRAISRNTVAYGYLPESIGVFATPAEFVTILRNAGFTDVEAVPLTFGAVFLYTARRS